MNNANMYSHGGTLSISENGRDWVYLGDITNASIFPDPPHRGEVVVPKSRIPEFQFECAITERAPWFDDVLAELRMYNTLIEWMRELAEEHGMMSMGHA